MKLDDSQTNNPSENILAPASSDASVTRHIPYLRLAVLLFFSAVLLTQVLGTTWSLFAIRHYPRARSGLPPYDGNWNDTPAFTAAGGIPVINSTDSAGPAARLGLHEGDLIVAINGLALTEDPEPYFRTLLRSSPGDSLRIEWIQDGDRRSGLLVLQELPSSLPTAYRQDAGFVFESVAMRWKHISPMLIFDIAALLLGVFIGFLKLRDTAAFRLATALLTSGTLVFSSRMPLSSLWPEWAAGPVYFCAFASIAVMGPMWIGFLAIFPVRTRMGARLQQWWWLSWIVFGAWALGDTLNSAGNFYPSLGPAAEALSFLRTRGDSWPMAFLVLLFTPPHLRPMAYCSSTANHAREGIPNLLTPLSGGRDVVSAGSLVPV